MMANTTAVLIKVSSMRHAPHAGDSASLFSHYEIIYIFHISYTTSNMEDKVHRRLKATT